ncbi:MAG: zinc ribbon domain-containing protein [Desulfobacterales bacterium]|jgi:hypothetical protein
MVIETREQVLERVLEMKKPVCPHCDTEMSLWEVPPISVGDGLGWGEPFLFICFNDECPSFVQGWDHIKENYAHTASYRCMNYPGTENFDFMPVYSRHGAKGQVIDSLAVAKQEALKESIKRGFSILAGCYSDKDGPGVLRLLMDPTEPARVRKKAAEMMGDLGELEAVEALRHLKTGNQLIDDEIVAAVKKIHKRFFTRECPFCAEVIKQRAKVCKHCRMDVAGE